MSMNPYKQARLDDNLTQKELANLLNITPQSILMIEQGLFNSPPISIRRHYPNKEDEYMNWIKLNRYQHPIYTHPSQANAETWYQFRKTVSPSFKGFCVRLYFQPSILREFELAHRNTDTLIGALLDSRTPVDVAYRITSSARVLISQGSR